MLQRPLSNSIGSDPWQILHLLHKRWVIGSVAEKSSDLIAEKMDLMKNKMISNRIDMNDSLRLAAIK